MRNSCSALANTCTNAYIFSCLRIQWLAVYILVYTKLQPPPCIQGHVRMACIEIVKAINTFTYFFLTDSVDEWKKQLAVYLIDYDSLDIKEIKASG